MSKEDSEKIELNNTANLNSTFAEVRTNKSAPIQSLLDKMLPKIIGRKFLLVNVDEQESTDQNNGQVTRSVLYTVRVISSRAKAYRELIQVKVKNSKPIISEEELDQVMMQTAKPIVLRFDGLAHYAYMGGETINASAVEKLNISVKEAMNHE